MTHGGPQSLFPINLRCEGDDTETRGVCLSFITGGGGHKIPILLGFVALM